MRSYYSAKFEQFLKEDESYILGELIRHHPFSVEFDQTKSWEFQIINLKENLSNFKSGFLLFEYVIPRMGKRVDVVLLYRGIVFILEFKVGATSFTKSSLNQVLDYSLDLKNFHEQSHKRQIVPILVATEAPIADSDISKYDDDVFKPIKTNRNNYIEIIKNITEKYETSVLDFEAWNKSNYKPTPTIIEAAQALYNNHSVKEICRSDSGAINLNVTSKAVTNIINSSKMNLRKSICFITGVPGSGKTLAGLNIVNEYQKSDEDKRAVFLSGNGPLVKVLQEALARDAVKNEYKISKKLTKGKVLSQTRAFIQNIHNFRDEVRLSNEPPIERLAIFDEAQRAWTLEQTKSFMKRKKGVQNFNKSEPEFLIEVFDRHKDWTTIVCLIGGGQEINTGEAGLPEWFYALKKRYPHWDVYVSNNLTDTEYTNGEDIFSLITKSSLKLNDNLHLSVSLRSFRSEKVSSFVKSLLEVNLSEAKFLFSEISDEYPTVLTRTIITARNWLKSKARGSESLGIIASSGAHRLKPYGLNIKPKVDPIQWFLNDKKDIRSSSFLENVATEFEIQGLELDWTCVAWDANLRMHNMEWKYKHFRGTNWQNVNDNIRKRYLLNTYRVLLTRARQGMVIFIPKGDETDKTRLPVFYDSIFNYLQDIGIPTLKD